MKSMKIIKRSGQEMSFDVAKIENAIRKASAVVDYKDALSEGRIKLIAEEVAGVCEARDRAMTVEEIQDVVETKLMEFGAKEIAKKYIVYRYKQQLLRHANTTDKQILSLIECNNEDVKQENSNKNPTINSVQRDYMAGEVSKDVSARLLRPRTSCRRTRKVSSISMTWTTTRSICTTATSSTSRTCCRTGRSFPGR